MLFAVIDNQRKKKGESHRTIYKTESIDDFLKYINESGIGGRNGI
jgi:hypothetical protein